MKRTVFLLAGFLCAAVIAFGQNDEKIYEIMYLKPTAGKWSELTKGMGDHNKKYHASGPFKVTVWSNYTGSHVNDIAWVMGPFTYTDLDSRPESKDHDNDWEENIAPYIEVTTQEYWSFDKDLSYKPENYNYGDKLVWTIFDLKPFEGYRFKEMCTKIIEVYKAKNYTYNFEVYWNDFDNKEGRDVAIEVDFEKWAFLDRDKTFKKDYEEVHGEGSFQHLLDEYRDIVISSEDELSELIPEMSGAN